MQDVFEIYEVENEGIEIEAPNGVGLALTEEAAMRLANRLNTIFALRQHEKEREASTGKDIA